MSHLDFCFQECHRQQPSVDTSVAAVFNLRSRPDRPGGILGDFPVGRYQLGLSLVRSRSMLNIYCKIKNYLLIFDENNCNINILKIIENV